MKTPTIDSALRLLGIALCIACTACDSGESVPAKPQIVRIPATSSDDPQPAALPGKTDQPIVESDEPVPRIVDTSVPTKDATSISDGKVREESVAEPEVENVSVEQDVLEGCLPWIPSDAFAALIVQPKRLDASRTGRAILDLDVFQQLTLHSPIAAENVDLVLVAAKLSSAGSLDLTTVIHLDEPVSQEDQLRASFGDLPAMAVDVQGKSYFQMDQEAFAAQQSTGPEPKRSIGRHDRFQRPEKNRPAVVHLADGWSHSNGVEPVVVYHFPDDQTIVRTNGDQIKTLLDGQKNPTDFSAGFKQMDLDHDLIAMTSRAGDHDPAWLLLARLALRLGTADLQGLDQWVEQLGTATVTVDFSGEQLAAVELTSIESLAPSTESETDSNPETPSAESLLVKQSKRLLETYATMAQSIPTSNPLHATLNQLLADNPIEFEADRVTIRFAMPTGLAAQVNDDLFPSVVSTLSTMFQAHEKETSSKEIAFTLAPNPWTPTAAGHRQPPRDHPEFRDLAVASHGCQIYFPGQPVAIETTVAIDVGKVHVDSLKGSTRRATYLLEIYSYPQALIDRIGVGAILSRTRDKLVDAPQGTLISSEDIEYQNWPAIDFVYRHPDTTGAGKGQVRAVLRGNQIFLMEVAGIQVRKSEISIFQNSLIASRASESTPAPESLSPTREQPKWTVPQTADRDAALQLVQQTYRKKFQAANTNQQKSQLAAEMLSDSEQIDVASQRYVLLDVARRVAVGSGDVTTTLAILDQLNSQFEIDRVAILGNALNTLATNELPPQQRTRWLNATVDLAESAISVDRYVEAIQLLSLASNQAETGDDAAGMKSISQRLAEVKLLAEAFTALGPYISKLKIDPNDDSANLAVGKYRCFLKGDFDAGLPLLARSGDNELVAIVQADLSAPTPAEDRILLGDRWWELAKSQQGTTKKSMQRRAAHWYQLALPESEGKEKEKLQLRIAETVAADSPETIDSPATIDSTATIDSPAS